MLSLKRTLDRCSLWFVLEQAWPN